MIIISNFMMATAAVLSLFLTLYMYLVIARAILSWVNPDPYNPIVRFLHNATEPLLYRVRRLLPMIAGGIDLSPFIIIVAIYFLQEFLVGSLRDLALSMR